MIIRGVALRDFRRFAALRIAFAPGFNVIIGNNEEGKSTLREAITLGLFQDARTRDKKVLRQRRWGATEQFGLVLELEEDGGRYMLVKDFQAKTAMLEDTGTGGQVHDGKTIEARVTEMVGLPSREVFESTVRIAQRDITQLKAGEEIADGLQRVLTGGDQDTVASRVLDDIDKALNRLRTAAQTNPGPLAVLPRQIADHQARLEAVMAALDGETHARTQLLTRERELAVAGEALALQRRQQQACAARLAAEDELKKAAQAEHDLDDRVSKATALRDKVIKLEAELNRQKALLDFGQEHEPELAVLEQAAADDPGVRAYVAPPLRPLWPVVLGAMVLIAIGFFTHLAVSAVGVCLIVFELWRARSTLDATQLAEQMRARERRAAAAKAKERLGQLLSSAGCETVAGFRERYRTAQDVSRQLGTETARLQGMLAGETFVAIEERRKEASRALRGWHERLDEPEMRLAQVDQQDYQRLLREIESRQRHVQAWTEDIFRLKAMIAANRTNIAELHTLEEALDELRDKHTAAEQRRQILVLTREVLEEARAAAMVSAKDALREELGKLVAEITRGRYRDVEVDDQLGIRMVAPETGKLVEVALDGELSTGTVEQVYIAARLAVAGVLAQGRRPPLILDDPFAGFDPERTQAVLALCRRLSADNQVLLFTCRTDYQASGDNVIRLPATA